MRNTPFGTCAACMAGIMLVGLALMILPPVGLNAQDGGINPVECPPLAPPPSAPPPAETVERDGGEGGLPAEGVETPPQGVLFFPYPREYEDGEEPPDTPQVPPARIPGRVVDGDGNPVAGAEVSLSYPCKDGDPCTTRTDARGCFVLWPGMSDWYTVRTHSLFLSATAPGGIGTKELYLCHSPEDAERMAALYPEVALYETRRAYRNPAEFPEVILGPEAGIRGLVLDDGGLPVAGVEVTAVPDRGMTGARTALTDHRGAYEINGLPPGPCQVRAAGGKVRLFRRFEPPRTVALVGGEITGMPPLSLHRHDRSLSLRVVNRHGEPVPGSPIFLQPLFLHSYEGGEETGLETDKEGRCVIDGLCAGGYLAGASGGRYLPVWRMEKVEPGGGVEHVLRIGAVAEVRGRVVDAETGAPVPGFTAALLPASGIDALRSRCLFYDRMDVAMDGWAVPGMREPMSRVVRDGAGRFSLGAVRCGQWLVAVCAQGYECAVEPVTVWGDGAQAEVTVALCAAEPESAPEPEVDAPPIEDEEGGVAGLTDEVREGLANGVVIRPCAFSRKNRGTDSLAQLDLKVFDGGGGPVKNYGGRIYSMAFPRMGAETGENGPGDPTDVLLLRPGRFRIYGWKQEGLYCFGGRMGMTEAELTAGVRSMARVVIPPGPVTIAGGVRVNGLCPQDGEVRAMTPEGVMLARGRIDDGGRFVLEDMPPGRVLLRFEISWSFDPCIPALTAFRCVHLPRRGTLRELVELETSGPVLGRFTPPDIGREACVLAFPAEFSLRERTRLDDVMRADSVCAEVRAERMTGCFQPALLAAGNYRIAVAVSPGDSSLLETHGWLEPDWRGGWGDASVTLPACGAGSAPAEFFINVPQARAGGGGYE